MVLLMNTVNYFGKNYTMNYLEDLPDCAVNKAVNRGRIWEPRIVKMYSKFLNKDSVVLDIGAHLGTHTIPLSHLCKEVYSFEPQKKIFTLLKKTITDNQITNVNLFNNVVSETDGDIVDFVNSNTGKGSLWTFRPYLAGDTSEEITMTIDNLNLPKVDFMKIDAEKTEWLVLRGAKSTIIEHKPIILLETFRSKQNRNKLNCFCEIYNYEATYIACDNWLLKPVDI